MYNWHMTSCTPRTQPHTHHNLTHTSQPHTHTHHTHITQPHTHTHTNTHTLIIQPHTHTTFTPMTYSLTCPMCHRASTYIHLYMCNQIHLRYTPPPDTHTHNSTATQYCEVGRSLASRLVGEKGLWTRAPSTEQYIGGTSLRIN